MNPAVPQPRAHSPVSSPTTATADQLTRRSTLELNSSVIEPDNDVPSTRSTARPWERILFALATASLVLFAIWANGEALNLRNSTTGFPIVTQILLVALSAVAAALGLGAANRPDVGSATKRAWRLFAVAQIATAIVSLSWVFRMATGSTAAGGLPIQLIAACYDVFLLFALLAFPVRRMQDTDRATFWFDSAIVAGVATVLMWHLLLRTALIAAGADWRTSMYALIYPVADVVLLFASIVLLLRRPLSGSVRAIRILFLSILLNTAADVLYMWAYIAKDNGGGRFFYLAWAVVAWMATAAAYSQGKNIWFGLFSANSAMRGRRGMAPSLIPYAAILAIYVTLLVEVVKSESLSVATGLTSGSNTLLITKYPITGLVIGAIVVTAIVIARQVAAQRKNSELAAERLAREAHFRALVQHSSDMVLVLDADGLVREASPAVERVLGHRPESVVGRPFHTFFISDETSAVQADIAQAIAATDGHAATGGAVEWRVRSASGSERWIEAILTNLLGDPVVHGLVINGRDVSERKQLETELTHRAYHDTLTGLVNAARFRLKIADAIAHAGSGARPGDGRSGLAILYIDLDGFKAVNDMFGHGAGDIVLATVADRLRDATRGSDTAARLGGDEFAILLERLRDEDEVRMVVNRVLQLVHRPVRIDHREATVDASIGIVCSALGGNCGNTPISVDADTLLRQADTAMYAAKARGCGQFQFFRRTADADA